MNAQHIPSNLWKQVCVWATCATVLAYVVPYAISRLFLDRPVTREKYGLVVYLWPGPLALCAAVAIVAAVAWVLTSIMRRSPG